MKWLVTICALFALPVTVLGASKSAVPCIATLNTLSEAEFFEEKVTIAYQLIVETLPNDLLAEMIGARDAFFEPEDISSQYSSVFDGLAQIRSLISEQMASSLLQKLEDIYRERRKSEERAVRISKRISNASAKHYVEIARPEGLVPSRTIFTPDNRSILMTSYSFDYRYTYFQTWKIGQSETWKPFPETMKSRVSAAFDPEGKLLTVDTKLGKNEKGETSVKLFYSFYHGYSKEFLIATGRGWMSEWTQFSADRKKAVFVRSQTGQTLDFDIYDFAKKKPSQRTFKASHDISFIGKPTLSADGNFLHLKMKSSQLGWIVAIDLRSPDTYSRLHVFDTPQGADDALMTTGGAGKELFFTLHRHVETDLIRAADKKKRSLESQIFKVALSRARNLVFSLEWASPKTKIGATDCSTMREVPLGIEFEAEPHRLREFEVSSDGKFLLLGMDNVLRVYLLEYYLD